MHNRIQFAFRCRSNLRAVVQEYAQFLNVVHRLAAQQRMRAGTGRSCGYVSGRSGANVLDDAFPPGFPACPEAPNARKFRHGVDFQNLVHVFAEIENHRDVEHCPAKLAAPRASTGAPGRTAGQ